MEQGTGSAQLSRPPREELVFGSAGSPLIVDDTVIVTPGGDGCAMMAFDLLTGNKHWSAGESTICYSSPHLARFSCGHQLLTLGSTAIVGHDVSSGAVLWSSPFGERSTEFVNVCQPVPLTSGERDRVLISAGYGRGCKMLELQTAGETIEVAPLWKSLNLKSKFASIVVSGNFAYGLDERILTCIDLESGERKWKGGRYGHGQLIIAGDTLLILAENGDVVLVEAKPTAFKELSRFKALASRTWTHPVLAGSLFLVRNDREAACYAFDMRE
ncbi:MAG: PQQ-binding-like beta-propeller repeat protein [Planctomycetaceae bacterium]